MAIAWGRDATITLNGVALLHTKDIATTEETKMREIMPRASNGMNRIPGRQDTSVTFGINVTTHESYAGLVALRNSRASVPVVVADGTSVPLSFTGIVERIEKSNPENGASVAQVTIVKSQ